jgi:hypothetical protein
VNGRDSLPAGLYSTHILTLAGHNSFPTNDVHPFDWRDVLSYIMPVDGKALVDSYLVYPYLLGHGPVGVPTSPSTAILHSDIKEGLCKLSSTFTSL